MRRYTYLALIVLIILSAPACSMSEAVSRMSVKLEKVKITHMDNAGFDATLYMQVNNPNWFGMTVSDFRYRAFVDGQQLAWGSSDKDIVIPAEGSATAELPLEVSYGDVREKMYQILRGQLGYRVTGEVGFKTWLGRYAIQFDTGKKPDNEAGGKPDASGGGDRM